MSLQPGEVFAGYTIVRELGSGGMGQVYLAVHPRLPRQVALKLLRPGLGSDPAFAGRFQSFRRGPSFRWTPESQPHRPLE